jgi:hypothetical protein
MPDEDQPQQQPTQEPPPRQDPPPDDPGPIEHETVIKAPDVDPGKIYAEFQIRGAWPLPGERTDDGE